MISLDEAQTHVLSNVCALPAKTVALADAAGLVLAETVVSRELVPPFANTAMDGFAVKAADTANAPVSLAVIGTVAAGERATKQLGSGEAMRIMTGAPIPDGADAVVMVEKTNYHQAQNTVDVQISVSKGNHVRQAGEDVAPGDELFAAGAVLGAGHLGVLASVGVTAVAAHPRPRVGVISTGDELVDGNRPLQPGEIRDSNRLTLLTLLAESGMEAVDLGIVGDNETALTEAFGEAAMSCDAIVSSGGVSMGAFDYVKVVLDHIAQMRWMQIAIKPAKPFAFGLIGQTPVFGLPGNPVSSMVSYELLARPALLKMAGHTNLKRPHRIAICEDPLGMHGDDKTHFLRVVGTVDRRGNWTVHKLRAQGSHQLSAMAQANALAMVPDRIDVGAGDEVEIILLGTT